VRLDQVAAADLDGLEPQLPGDEADDPLHDEGALGPAGAAVGRDHGGVGVGHLELDRVVAEPVRAGELGGGDERHDDAVRRVGPGVVDEAVAQRQDPSLGVDGDLDVVALAALLGGGDQVLPPVLRPLHRPAETDRRVGHQDLLRVEEHDLGAEAPAHVGRHHRHVELRQAEDPRQPVLDGQRRLGRVPHAERARAAVVLGDDAPAFEGAAAAPLDLEPLAEPASRAGEGRLGVARALGQPGRAVAGDVGVDTRGALGQRGLEARHGRQGLPRHVDRPQRVLGRVAVHGHDEGYGLADVADLLDGQRAGRPRVRERRVGDQQRRRLVDGAEVGAGHDQRHPGQRPGAGGVDGRDPRVSVRAPEDRGVQQARRVQVVDVAAEPAQQPRILVAGKPGSEGARRHREAWRSATVADTSTAYSRTLTREADGPVAGCGGLVREPRVAKRGPEPTGFGGFARDRSQRLAARAPRTPRQAPSGLARRSRIIRAGSLSA
jgi:hypothetical protein